MESYAKHHFKGRWVYLVVLAMIVGVLSGMHLRAETSKEIRVGGMQVEFTDVYLTEVGGEEDVDITRPIYNGETKEAVYKLKLTHCKALSTTEAIQVTLPEELKLIHDEEISLKADIPKVGIKEVGRCRFTAEDGLGVITFNEVLKDYESANLGFAIGVNIGAKKIPGEEGIRRIVFKVGDVEKGLDVNFTGETTQAEEIETPPKLTKTHDNVDEAQGKIKWRIHVEAGNKDLKDIVLKDTYSNSQLELDTIEKDGISYSNYEIKTEGSKDSISIHIPELPAGKACEFYVITHIKKDIYREEQKVITIKNTASLQDDKGNKLVISDASDAVKIKVAWITKSGKYREEKQNGMLIKKIDWKLVINSNKQDISGYVLKDYLPKGVTLDKESIRLNGQSIEEASELGSISYFTESGSKAYVLKGETKYFEYEGGMKYVFQETLTPDKAHQTYTITYTTTILGSAQESVHKGEYYNLVGIGESEGIFEENKPGVFYDYKGVGINISDIVKKATNYDQKKHEITWEVTANRYNNEVKQLEIIDTLPEGLKINLDTIRINSKQIKNQGDAVSADGDIVATYDYDAAARVLKCKIYSRAGKTFNQYYTVDFKSEVIEKEVYANNFQSGKEYINHAKVIYTYKNNEQLESPDIAAKLKIKGLVLTKHAGNYNSQTGEMTWLIVVNHQGIAMEDAVITDTLDGQQQYIEGSIKVLKGDYSAKDSKVIEEAENIMPTLVPEVKEDGKVIICKLGNIDKTYTIIIKTKIIKDSVFKPNEKVALHNKVSISSPSIFGDIKPVNAEKEINNSFVLKAGTQVEKDKPLSWYLLVNPNQVPLKEIVVTDCLSSGLKLKMDSIKIFKVIGLTKEVTGLKISDIEKLNKTEIKLDETQINYDKQTNTISFALGDITECYLIAFQTTVTDIKPSKQYTNKAYIEGIKEERWQTGSEEIEVKTQFSRSWGSVELPTGTIEIVKIDEASRKPLKGAEFKLSDGVSNVIVITDEEGKAIFDDLILDKTYRVYESKAPEGYKLESGEKIITVNSSETIKLEFTNKKEVPSSSPSPSPSSKPDSSPKPGSSPKPNPSPTPSPTITPAPSTIPNQEEPHKPEINQSDEKKEDIDKVTDVEAYEEAVPDANVEAYLEDEEALPKTGSNAQLQLTMLLGCAFIMLCSGVDYARRNKK